MSYYSQNVFVKIWLIINVIMGIASGAFFAYESHKSCGDIYTAISIACFLFSFINLVLLGFKQLWNKYISIFNIVLFVCFSIIAFVSVHQVNKETLCENQWCISQGVDTAEFLAKYKDNHDTESAVSKFCSTKLETQKQTIQIFASVEYKLILTGDDIWYIENSAPFALSAMIGSMCILMCILLIADIIRQRKKKHNKSLLV